MSGIDIVNMVGGLGNQLFQYLFGSTLAAMTGRRTVFDISDFHRYNLHDGYTIEKYFDVELPVVSRILFGQTPWMCRGYLRKRIASSVVLRRGLSLPIHTDYTFDLRCPPSLNRSVEYFFGYWQSQCYANKNLEVAHKSLTFRKEIRIAVDHAIKQWDIIFEKAAALHIRRGDYLTAPSSAPQYALPVDFYIQAMDFLMDEKGITRFYIFSDDIENVKSLFPRHYDLHFIDRSVSVSPGIDMCLMTRFSDMVISNSTFGWWAATLRENQDGLVFYPSPWVKPKFINDTTKSARPLARWRPLNWDSA